MTSTPGPNGRRNAPKFEDNLSPINKNNKRLITIISYDHLLISC